MLLTALALLLGLAADAPVDLTHPRVRTLDAQARAIVADAQRSSPTVADLVATIERSNLVVYVQTQVGLRYRGSLQFASHAAPLTYVVIRLTLPQSSKDRIATLAHELTHAAEIAEAQPPVRSEPELVALYRRIGYPGTEHEAYESSRARTNERLARQDLRIIAADVEAKRR